MEDPNHYPGSTENNNRRRGRTCRNVASRNPSAQETMNGPRQADSGRRRVKENRDPEGEERDYTVDQWTTKQAKGAQETTPNPITQEPGGNKRPTAQEGGACKKSKAQQASPNYTIMEDDGEMITRMVQDFLAEDFDHAAHHRDKLQKEMIEMGQFLKKFGEAQTESNK
jgi:hypothetical protein